MTPPEGDRAKLAGEVTEGDRALWESLCRLNACAANVEDYQEESVALIAKFRASVAVAEAESKVAALEALVVRLSESLSKARLFQQKTAGHHIWNPEEQELFADLVAACSLVPADLADCVCVKRSEWDGSGFPEMKREVEQLRYDVSKLEVENKRLVAVLGMVKSSIREKDGGVIKLAYFTPSEVLMIDLALAPADEKVSKAALQPAPKV